MKPLYLLCLLLVSCQASRTPAKSYYEQEEAQHDTSKAVPSTDKRDSPFKSLFAKRNTAPKQSISTLPAIPKKCKGCTFNVAAPGATISNVGKKATAATAAGATAIGKAKGQTVTGDSSTANTVGSGTIANVAGDGNHLTQTPTVEEAADWKAVLAEPTGQVLAGLIGLGILGLGVWGFLAYRKKRAVAKIIVDPTKIVG